MKVWVAGKPIAADATRSIGKGGEADVFDAGDGRALKLFKPPDHPDLDGDPAAQAAARARIEEHQSKLRSFPPHLPPHVVVPDELATTRDGRRVLGYTMPLLAGGEVLLRYGERGFRQGGIGVDAVIQAFRDLHGSVAGLHAAGVVIGDFNDLNVLVRGAESWLIDADSFQFGRFTCRVFTERFVDPLLCDPRASRPLLRRPHGAASDWYAYAVMLMRSLLYVDPYGGVLKPEARPRLAQAARPLHRVTVFHPDVRYPRPALPWSVLPDELLGHLRAVFERDLRGAFPLRLLDDLRFTRCTLCGAEHARRTCPACSAMPAAAVREATVVRGSVRAARVFRTRGRILWAGLDGGRLVVLAHEDGLVRREDGAVVLAGDPSPRARFGVCGARSLLAQGGQVLLLAPGAAPARTAVDVVSGEPAFGSNGRLYWAHAGRLWREGRLGPERIGDVLAGQTRFWVGRGLGFGLSRAGELQLAFVFDPEGRVLNDGVRLPPLRGQLVDAFCCFGDGQAWFLASLRDAGRTTNRCLLVRRDGTLAAAAEAEAGDGSWLSQIGGASAAGAFLLAPTDSGVVRVEADAGRLVVTRAFPDTEAFVDAGSRLLAGADGLYVVGRDEVRRLTLG